MREEGEGNEREGERERERGGRGRERESNCSSTGVRSLSLLCMPRPLLRPLQHVRRGQ